MEAYTFICCDLLYSFDVVLSAVIGLLLYMVLLGLWDYYNNFFYVCQSGSYAERFSWYILLVVYGSLIVWSIGLVCVAADIS